MSPPLCECHGLPMRWWNDVRARIGGTWRCAERNRERMRDLRADPSYVERERDRRIQVSIGGQRFSYRVMPERREELVAQIAHYRTRQASDYRRVANDGWIDTSV